jgi:type IV pilus assembly protein PilY1
MGFPFTSRRTGISIMAAIWAIRRRMQEVDEVRNIITYTIGFSRANRLLLETAFNGNGFHGRESEWADPESPLYHKYFYTAYDYDGLRKAIREAMRGILVSPSSGTGAAVVSTGNRTDDLLIRASFHPTGWRGFLDAFELTEDQTFDPARARWKAGELLAERDPGDREVFTVLRSVTGLNEKLAFTEVNATRTDVDNQPLYKLLNAQTEQEGNDIIGFIRGTDGDGLRERDGSKLGDIVHSTPVTVGPANGYFNDVQYLHFKRQQASRERMVYVGANDGMLHAFYVDGAQGGSEAWAFIPNSLLGKLKNLTLPDYDSCHEYFVDLTPTVTDVLVDLHGAGTREWRTLLIGGEREGGKSYFALDVTTPSRFAPLWEFSDEPLGRLGESWSIPAIERVDLGETDRWLAFVGNGFNNRDGQGYLFAIDLETGESFMEPIPLGGGSSNVLASLRAVDINGDGYGDSLFAGDLAGRMWKFDITNQIEDPETYRPLDTANWQSHVLFETLEKQPIISPVGLSFYCSNSIDRTCENLMVYFGTGKFLTTEDKTDKALQSFYAVKDEFVDITRGEMANRTAASDCETQPDPYQTKGWYVDLLTPGERVSSSPLVIGELVFFLTFLPEEDPCGAGGTARLYYREFDTGCVPEKTVFAEDADPGEGERPEGKIVIGPGYAPEIVYCAKTEEMVIQTSDREVHRLAVSLRRSGIENYSWREVLY